MPRIVHLGLGNFHRAHQAVYTQEADPGWSITGVANTNRRLVEDLRAQDMVYGVISLGEGEAEVQRMLVIDRALVLADDPPAVVEAIADEDTQVLTLTITEAGYVPSLSAQPQRSGGAGSPSMLQALGQGLALRAERGEGPLSILSCDNLVANGDTLRDAVTSVVESMSRSDLASYLQRMVTFPSTMVDRIVPATTAETVRLASELGLTDRVPVATETFRQWVIQPSLAGPRPRWETAGAIISEDVAAWEQVKLRLLNGVHSLLAYLGILSGWELIAEAHADPLIAQAAQSLSDEYLPTMELPVELDLVAYRDDLDRRWSNRALGHCCLQVGADGSTKLPQRIPLAAHWYLSRGETPRFMALTIAAYLAVMCHPGEIAGGVPSDPLSDLMAETGATARSSRELVEVALETHQLLGRELAASEALVSLVTDTYSALRAGGVAAALSLIG